MPRQSREAARLTTYMDSLTLDQQADASNRPPVCVYTQYFYGSARPSPVSNSLSPEIVPNTHAYRFGCIFCLWPPDTRESQSRVPLGLSKSPELHNPDKNWKTKLTSRRCPARQNREFWSRIFKNRRVRPEFPRRCDCPRLSISLGFCIATVHRSRTFSTQ
jgi:hypothetical protein